VADVATYLVEVFALRRATESEALAAAESRAAGSSY
jgi:hypothetical protein